MKKEFHSFVNGKGVKTIFYKEGLLFPTKVREVIATPEGERTERVHNPTILANHLVRLASIKDGKAKERMEGVVRSLIREFYLRHFYVHYEDESVLCIYAFNGADDKTITTEAEKYCKDKPIKIIRRA